MARFTSSGAQLGLTLIEMLVSITIGLIVVGAVTYLYVSSKGAYRGNESLARIQEAGRFALDSITRDVRRTGALGCGSVVSPTSGSPVTPNMIGMPFPAAAIQGWVVPVAWTAPAGAPAYLAGDVIQLQIVGGAPVRMSNNPDLVNATVTIADNSVAKFKINDYAMVADCTSATVFKVVTVQPVAPAPATLLQYWAGAPPPALTTGSTGFSVDTFPTVQRFDQVSYYVGTAPGGAVPPLPALYRYSVNSGLSEELVENIQDMDIVYGVDTTPNDNVISADVFEHADLVTAAAAWPNVVSVRVSLLAVGDQLGALPAPQTVTFRGAPWTAPDTRLYQVFTSTAALRGRVQ